MTESRRRRSFAGPDTPCSTARDTNGLHSRSELKHPPALLARICMPAPRLLMRSARSTLHMLLLLAALAALFLNIAFAATSDGGARVSTEARGLTIEKDATFIDPLNVGSVSRRLLHPGGPPSTIPFCSRCRLYHCVGNWWHGHCRKNQKLFKCRRRKNNQRAVETFQPVNATSVAEEEPADRSGIPSPPPAGPAFPPLEQNLTATAPFVACLSASDCLLPATDFAAINSSAPLSSGGNLAGSCLRPDIVNDRSGNFIDLPGICVCTYVAAAAPPGVRDLLSTCSTARDTLLSFNSVIIDDSPLSSLISTGNCLQGDDFPSGTPFFGPGDGPYPLSDADADAPEANFTIVTDPSLFASGVVVEAEYVDGLDQVPDDPPGPCPIGSACVRDNRQCAGSTPELELARACCNEAYQCVRRSDDFAQCRLGGVPGIVGWEGSILPCGTAHDAIL